MSRESDLTQLWLKWVESELSQVSKFGFWVESELSQVSKFGIWVESELSHLDCHMSQSRVSPKKMSRAQPCFAGIFCNHVNNGCIAFLLRLWFSATVSLSEQVCPVGISSHLIRQGTSFQESLRKSHWTRRSESRLPTQPLMLCLRFMEVWRISRVKQQCLPRSAHNGKAYYPLTAL